MPASPILLVGFQRGVLPALRKLGRPAVLLVREDRGLVLPEEIEDVRHVDLHGGRRAIEAAARDLLGGRLPAAVVALAERTVVVGAGLRGVFDLGGNGPAVALACADKLRMKETARAEGVPVTDWVEVDRGSDPAAVIEALGLPLVLKPRRDSGGRGQMVIRDARDLPAGLAALDLEGYGWIAEAWIEGTESSVECFVADGEVLFTNHTEYLVPRHANVVPSALAGEELARIGDFAARAAHSLGVRRGMTHMEVFRTERGLVMGELAIRPPGGRIMTLLQRAWGFDPWEALLRLELGERPEFPRAPRRTAGVYILHPGAGRVRAIRGADEAAAVPGIRKVQLKVHAGDVVAERVGSGQDIGAIHAEGPDRDGVADALMSASRRLCVEFEPNE